MNSIERPHSVSVEGGVVVPKAGVVDDDGGLRLLGGRCAKCDLTTFPALAQCSRCWGPVDQLALSGRGSLYSYSVVHVASGSRQIPYTVGYIDLPDRARLFGHIDEVDEDRLTPNMGVELRLRRDSDQFVAIWEPGDRR
jgi:uncharacterized OB-fold protein